MFKIRLSFHGGVREVGRSCIGLDTDGYRIVMDCGLNLGSEDERYPIIPGDVDSFILTHAHLDHSGMIPPLWRNNKCPLYGTELSFELSHLLLKDSLKIAREKGHDPGYSKTDLKRLPADEKFLDYGQEIKLNKNVSMKLIDAGHIPGSSSILLKVKEDGEEKKVLYTGDIKASDTHLLKGGKFPDADYLIIESTYGNKVHPDRAGLEKDFRERIIETLENGGNALVAAFAVGRTQEMMMMLHDLGYPVYVDGMGIDVARLFLQYPGYLRNADALKIAGEHSLYVDDWRMRRKAAKEPSIIITTAGMVNGGPVLYYLKKLHGDPMSSIFLTGYQVEGTNGRYLLNEDYVMDPRSREEIHVKMNKYFYDFSAHSGRNSLEEVVREVDPEKCILVHGEGENIESFENWCSEDYDTYVPKLEETLEI